MKKEPLRRSERHGGGRWLLVLVVAVVVGFGLWGGLRRGPAPEIVIETERPAVGLATRVVARFKEGWGGLGAIKLELVQGDQKIVLGEKHFPQRGAFSPTRGSFTAQASLEASAGRRTQGWLKEGEVVLRASASRIVGPLRSAAPVVVERRLPARFRPPHLELESKQHYVRQGGAGAVVFRVSETATRSGVRAGTVEALSYPLPGGGPGERFTLFAIPWELADPSQVRLFAEDDAGNRAEQAFVDLFKPIPPHHDTIALTDAFLQKVVPEIASQTPGFDTRGSLLDQYLRINGELRRDTLAKLAALAANGVPRFLWSGAFLQMHNTQRRASFAENRTYMFQGRVVDQQTHLGLDLASTPHAAVPAANAGNVVFAGWLAIYGNAVVIDHGYGLMSLYGHMSSLSVKAGDMVARGQPIGWSGATGLAGGDHLHLEILIQGKSVDPVEWLDEHWIRDNLGSKVKLQ